MRARPFRRLAIGPSLYTGLGRGLSAQCCEKAGRPSRIIAGSHHVAHAQLVRLILLLTREAQKIQRRPSQQAGIPENRADDLAEPSECAALGILFADVG